jgi:endogenous inhibitor of DNA gyrase (YacG/DUF329 family)
MPKTATCPYCKKEVGILERNPDVFIPHGVGSKIDPFRPLRLCPRSGKVVIKEEGNG